MQPVPPQPRGHDSVAVGSRSLQEVPIIVRKQRPAARGGGTERLTEAGLVARNQLV